MRTAAGPLSSVPTILRFFVDWGRNCEDCKDSCILLVAQCRKRVPQPRRTLALNRDVVQGVDVSSVSRVLRLFAL